MIRRYLAPLRAALMLSDAITAFLLFLVLVSIRLDVLEGTWAEARVGPIELGGAYALLWVGALWFVGLYRLRTHWTLRGELFEIVRAGVMLAFVALAGLFVFNLTSVSRLLLAMLFVVQPVVTIASRIALRALLRRLREQGRMEREMLIIGAGANAEEFANRVEQQRELGLHVLGHLLGPRDSDEEVTRPVIGTINDIEDVLATRVVDEVAVCLEPQDWSYVEPATRICEEQGRIVRVALQPFAGLLTGGEFENVGGLAVVSFLYGPDRIMSMAFKRLLDVLVSGALLILMSPVVLGVTLWIRATDGPPVLFRHVRVGLHGRTFTCLKFRTMVRGAEEMNDDLEFMNEMDGPAFKVSDDPRVTAVGQFLRKWSLDELPQLINVLRGEMSLVGPRPAPPREVEGYSIWHRRRLAMRPGLTGYWQVEARSDESFDRRAELDLAYIDRWSLWMDFKIMARTIPAIISQQGR